MIVKKERRGRILDVKMGELIRRGDDWTSPDRVTE